MLYLKEISDRYNIIIKSWKLDNFSFFYPKIKGKNKNICINFDLDNYTNFQDFFAVLRDIYSCKKDLSNITFCINLKDTLFTQEEFENIKKLEKILKTQNAKLYIKEYDVLWEISEVNKTYDYLKQIINEISSKNLSPLEQFLYAYKKIAENVYSDDKTLKNLVITHSIFSLQNNGYIVCRSYANMLCEIINGLKNDDLHCFLSSVQVHDETTSGIGSHAMNVVMLKDDKYNINGIYSTDCTWDSSNEKNAPISLTYCLLPLDDLKFYKNTQIIPATNNTFQYFLVDDNSMSLYKYQNAITLDALKHQHVVDVENQRSLYKQYILQNEPSLAIYTNSTPFGDEMLEYRFIKSVCNKIKQKSTVIPYDALYSAFLQCLKAQNIDNAEDYAEEVFSSSKQRSLNNFIYCTKNCLYETARKEFDRVEAVKLKRKQLLQRHKEVLARKRQQKKQEDEKTM